VFLSNPLADPVGWSAGVRDDLLGLGYSVTTFEHRPEALDWRSAVTCVEQFLAQRTEPVALVGWSQGAALAQEVTLASGAAVGCAILLATYGRQNEIDRILQRCWDRLATPGGDLDNLRLAMALLTSFPPDSLADDDFVAHMGLVRSQWAGRPDPAKRLRASTFMAPGAVSPARGARRGRHAGRRLWRGSGQQTPPRVQALS